MSERRQTMVPLLTLQARDKQTTQASPPPYSLPAPCRPADGRQTATAVSPDRISDATNVELDLPPLRDVISRYGLAARRSMGQHFLLDGNLTNRIAQSAAPLAGMTIVEIGPGPGGLTRSLLASDAARVVAVERDKRFIPPMQDLKNFYPDRLEIIEADALTLNPRSFSEAGEKIIIVANLPYNIATPLLINWLRAIDDIKSMTLMFQKEVADRIVAAPGTGSYGRLSVISQWLCETVALFDIQPQAFVPPPKVTSTVVQFTPRAGSATSPKFTTLEAVTRSAFGQRRKMLRSSLKSLTTNSGDLLALANIESDRRAETLSVTEFSELALAYEDLIGDRA